jgi:hypothetical protein
LIIGLVGTFFGRPLLSGRPEKAAHKGPSPPTFRIVSASCTLAQDYKALVQDYKAGIFPAIRVVVANSSSRPITRAAGLFKLMIQEYGKDDALFATRFAFLPTNPFVMLPNERRAFRWPVAGSGADAPAYVRVSILPELIAKEGGIPTVDWDYQHPVALAGQSKIACLTPPSAGKGKKGK